MLAKIALFDFLLFGLWLNSASCLGTVPKTIVVGNYSQEYERTINSSIEYIFEFTNNTVRDIDYRGSLRGGIPPCRR